MGDIVNLGEHRPGWITTPAICFNCTEYWVAVLEPDSRGLCIYNHLECPACGDYRGVAIGALMDHFWESMQRADAQLPGMWREPLYPEFKTMHRERFNPKGNLGDFPTELSDDDGRTL